MTPQRKDSALLFVEALCCFMHFGPSDKFFASRDAYVRYLTRPEVGISRSLDICHGNFEDLGHNRRVVSTPATTLPSCPTSPGPATSLPSSLAPGSPSSCAKAGRQAGTDWLGTAFVPSKQACPTGFYR